MVVSAITYLALAGAVWIFLRLFQACFSLPRHLRKQNDVQQMLQEKIDGYEKYVQECEEKDRALGIECDLEGVDDKEDAERADRATKWKERRECLEMLKKELNRIRDGGDINDWDHLLDADHEGDDNSSENAMKNETTSCSSNTNNSMASGLYSGMKKEK
ncbi:uncharacterized protein LOC105704403 isoform X2 [Orussus abietinus]|nr:uncharacterized protein LOC105704403 isoform X2 [Orussus abietinus]